MKNINTVISSIMLLFYGFFYFIKFKELMGFGITTILTYLLLLTGIIALILSLMTWEGKKIKYGIYIISILTFFFIAIFYIVDISYIIPFIINAIQILMIRKNAIE